MSSTKRVNRIPFNFKILSRITLQFINLPFNTDPDSYLKNNEFVNLISILKNPKNLINFILERKY